MYGLLLLFLIVLAGPALAQSVNDPNEALKAIQQQRETGKGQPIPAQESTAMRGLVLALQQVGVSAEQYVNDVRAQLAAKDAQIADLIQKCGDACKVGGK